MKIRTGGNALTALIAAASISSAWAQGATQRPSGSLLVPIIRVGEVVKALPRAAMLPVGIRPLAAPADLLLGGVSLSVAPAAGSAAVLGRLQTATQQMTQAAQNGQTQEVSNQLSALYGEKGQADGLSGAGFNGGNGGIISIDMHYSILKRRIAERGVKAEVSIQSARGQSGAWFVVTLANAEDLKKIDDLFEYAGGEWTYQQIPVRFGVADGPQFMPPHRDPAIIKQELQKLQGSLIGPLRHPHVPHQGFLVDSIALDETGAMPRLVITFRGSLDRLKDYVNKRHPEIALKGLPVEYVPSIAG